jgi:hypothetical protein
MYELVTIDYFHLNKVLIKMVGNNQLSQTEREELLHKSGLIKSEDNKWKQNNGTILTMKNK